MTFKLKPKKGHQKGNPKKASTYSPDASRLQGNQEKTVWDVLTLWDEVLQRQASFWDQGHVHLVSNPRTFH